MNHRSHRFPRALSLAFFLAMLPAVPVQAGPAEDYAQGAKLYAAGDLIAAMAPLRKAADAGHAAAQAALGQILLKADWSEEAVEYFRKSAAQGDANGQFELGALLASGRGTPKNTAEARKWIELAAGQGHRPAISELALAYISGGLGIPEDARQSPDALRWIRAAADNGSLTAMERLSVAYRKGEFGMAADVKVADQWVEKINKIRGIEKTRRSKRRSNP